MEVGLGIGYAFLSSALNVFFDRMIPKFPNLFQGRKADDQLLRKLKRTLFVIEIVLDDAEDKQNTNKHVKQWLHELKSTVYDAEDLIDEINTEALRLEIESGHGSLPGSVSHLSDEFLNHIIPKIEEVVTTLEHFAAQIKVLGLCAGSTKKDNSYRQPSTSLVDESDVFGRDNEREELIHMALSDNANGNSINVIPIVGMGGIGKTTMAQIIYSDERVIKHFEKRAWVCVSENFDSFKITKTLVDEVTDSGSEVRDDYNKLQVKLKESLTGKKFLIVIDDIWNENYNDWNTLIAPLKFGKRGSKIIVTTRNEKVALMVRNKLPIHYLHSITDENCWLLFKKHAFDNGGPLSTTELEKIGKEMVIKCQGLPLAVITLGGLLRSKIEVKEWEDILKSHVWNSENNANDVLPVLRLSYHHLPPQLKHCFSFCALFPKNYKLEERELILLWMANDLLQHPTQNDKTIEDTGYESISELRSRSLFQKVSDGIYIMHDLVNDLAQYVCENFCVSDESYYPRVNVPSEARHFSYKSEWYNAYERFKFLGQVKSLRTFVQLDSTKTCTLMTKMFSSDILPRLKCLRVLCLYGHDITEVPNSICNLTHLRYINLSCTLIKQLPDGICNLHNLQTLKLSYCTSLHELSLKLIKLVNLRHLEVIETELREMPSHMGRLKSLQTLTCFIIDKSPGRGIEELEKLQLHGYLIIKGLQNIIRCNDAFKANLKNKKGLEALILEWSGETDDSQLDRDILGKLQPHTSLKSLTINGYGGTSFPDWVAHLSYSNIVVMSLKNCRNIFSLPGLGCLLSLKSLTIRRLDYISKIGQEFYGDASLTKPFQSLTSLRIEQMPEWEEWDTSGNVDFSWLEELYINDCPKLIGKLPSQLLCLTKFEISGCQRLVFPDDWMSLSDDNQIDTQFSLASLQFLSISDMPNLKELPRRFLRLGGLEELTLKRCESLVTVLELMRSISKMIVKSCPSLVSLPTNVKQLEVVKCTKYEFPKGEPSEGCNSSLEDLQVENSGDSLNDISLGFYPKLLSLRISSCGCLRVSPMIQNLILLRKVEFRNCNSLLSFPQGGFAAPNLENFVVISCKKLKSLPEQMHSLNPSLRYLHIQNCPEIESFPEGGLPFSLEILSVKYSEKLINCQRNWDLQKLPALTRFTIDGGDNGDSFPEESMLPCSIKELNIRNNKNMRRLNEKGLLCLTSLTTLHIYNCPELISMQEKGLPTSLTTLYIFNCPKLMSLPEEEFIQLTSLIELWVDNSPLLTPHLERERGKYWPIIAHIPNIIVDSELIS